MNFCTYACTAGAHYGERRRPNIWGQVRSARMFDRLTAFGRPSGRYLCTEHSHSAPGKGTLTWETWSDCTRARVTPTVETGVGLHRQSGVTTGNLPVSSGEANPLFA